MLRLDMGVGGGPWSLLGFWHHTGAAASATALLPPVLSPVASTRAASCTVETVCWASACSESLAFSNWQHSSKMHTSSTVVRCTVMRWHRALRHSCKMHTHGTIVSLTPAAQKQDAHQRHSRETHTSNLVPQLLPLGEIPLPVPSQGRSEEPWSTGYLQLDRISFFLSLPFPNKLVRGFVELCGLLFMATKKKTVLPQNDLSDLVDNSWEALRFPKSGWWMWWEKGWGGRKVGIEGRKRMIMGIVV